jgi:hypothetical protein
MARTRSSSVVLLYGVAHSTKAVDKDRSALLQCCAIGRGGVCGDCEFPLADRHCILLTNKNDDHSDRPVPRKGGGVRVG